MVKTLRRAAVLWAALATVILAVTMPAYSQAPTDAQREAIKSQCRSDYMAHCSSIPPGGEASLQCLQKNMSSLSSSCQTAVRAVEAPAAPKAESAPAAAPAATTTAKPATETAAPKAASTTAKKPSDAQVAAIRSACRSDYPKVCAGVPTGGAPALQCLEKNKAKSQAPASRLSTRPAAACGARWRRCGSYSSRHSGSGGSGSRRWCCGRCGRARSCSSSDQPAAPMSARFAAVSRPAAAVSCNAWRRRRPRFHPHARECWLSSPRNNR